MAERYIQVFEEAAAVAEKDWQGPAAPPPLVDLNTVLRTQATGVLSANDRVRLGDPDRARFLTSGLYPEMPERIQRVIDGFQGRDALTVAELARIAASGLLPAGHDAGPETQSADQARLAFSSRFLVRLLNFGVLELT